MSLDALTWAFDQKLPCAKKMVLVALGDQANHDDECWPSQGYLAERCGLSRAHVNTILGELEADGFLYISSRSRKNGADTSNLYILAVPADPREAAAPGEGPREVAGCVYVLADGDRCKIGITRHLERRLRALESATGKPLKVVGTINCGMRKARNLETAAHDHFQDLRQKGEWFEVQGVVALEWIEAKAGEVVSTELTPPVSTTSTPGVAQADTPVSATSTPVSTEPSVFNRSGEPKVAGATPQSSLPGFDPPKPPPSKPKTGKGKKTQPGGVDPAVLTAAIAAYNAAALRLGWAECMNPHEERRRRLGARLVEAGGIDGWNVALEKAEASDFLMGRTPTREGHKQFRLDIDFLLQVSSFTRLMEGFYDNRNSNSGAGASLSPIRAAARAVAESLDR